MNLLDRVQLERFGLKVEGLSEKWEAMDLLPALDPQRPNDYFLFVGNDNDFIARHRVMTGQEVRLRLRQRQPGARVPADVALTQVSGPGGLICFFRKCSRQSTMQAGADDERAPIQTVHLRDLVEEQVSEARPP